jgi:hypothetical protein
MPATTTAPAAASEGALQRIERRLEAGGMSESAFDAAAWLAWADREHIDAYVIRYPDGDVLSIDVPKVIPEQGGLHRALAEAGDEGRYLLARHLIEIGRCYSA